MCRQAKMLKASQIIFIKETIIYGLGDSDQKQYFMTSFRII